VILVIQSRSESTFNICPLEQHLSSRTAAALRRGPSVVLEELPQRVDLRGGDRQHHQQVEAGPEGHAPQVVLQQVAVPGLRGPQQLLEVSSRLQPAVDRVQARLPQGDKRDNGSPKHVTVARTTEESSVDVVSSP